MLEYLQYLERILAIFGGITSLFLFIITLAHSWRVWRWKRRLTWDDALRVAEVLLKKIEGSHWKPDIVIGLGRSGGIWGGWLAGNLGSIPLAVVDKHFVQEASGLKIVFPGGKEVICGIRENCDAKMKVLVIQGASSVGGVFRQFDTLFTEYFSNWDVKYAVLYVNPVVSFRIDFVGRTLEVWPRQFPWHLRSVYRPYLRDIFSSQAVEKKIT